MKRFGRDQFLPRYFRLRRDRFDDQTFTRGRRGGGGIEGEVMERPRFVTGETRSSVFGVPCVLPPASEKDLEASSEEGGETDYSRPPGRLRADPSRTSAVPGARASHQGGPIGRTGDGRTRTRTLADELGRLLSTGRTPTVTPGRPATANSDRLPRRTGTFKDPLGSSPSEVGTRSRPNDWFGRITELIYQLMKTTL